ncbi:hypothetical protein DH2020_012731 [Rehmannia glutinosa]|uniref:Glucose-6-phosphate 1-epimerase n=1 Tax=Rehmannia glutinosa TaxID=99300 RepID=A0ABR0X065_REHGL
MVNLIGLTGTIVTKCASHVVHQAVWKPPKAIRGGIPICFPQFSVFGTLEQHGFAKNKLWSLDSSLSPLPAVDNQSTVDLILKSTEEDLKAWPHSAGKLTLIPRVQNTDNKAFSFTFAVCNYLSVSDIRFISY